MSKTTGGQGIPLGSADGSSSANVGDLVALFAPGGASQMKEDRVVQPDCKNGQCPLPPNYGKQNPVSYTTDQKARLTPISYNQDSRPEHTREKLSEKARITRLEHIVGAAFPASDAKSSLMFEPGIAQLTSDAKKSLRKDFSGKRRSIYLIIGYAPSDLTLAKARAGAIKEYLAKCGVDTARAKTEGRLDRDRFDDDQSDAVIVVN